MDGVPYFCQASSALVFNSLEEAQDTFNRHASDPSFGLVLSDFGTIYPTPDAVARDYDTLIRGIIHKHDLAPPDPEPIYPTDTMDSTIKSLNLRPAPHGGYISHSPTNSASLLSVHYLLGGKNSLCSWHRVPSEQVWCYNRGQTLKLHTIDASGQFSSHSIGASVGRFQISCPHNTWIRAHFDDSKANSSSLDYTLVTLVLAPPPDDLMKAFAPVSADEVVKLHPHLKQPMAILEGPLQEALTKAEEERGNNEVT